MPEPMTAEAAAWIRNTVLPPRYIASVTPLDICPCQWGPSGHCGAGRHQQCQRTYGWIGHGKPSVETHIVSRRDYAALTPVWRVGTACRWLCPCTCHATVMPLFAPPARRAPRRASSSGGNQRIASTDHLRAGDPDQPDLFEVLETSDA